MRRQRLIRTIGLLLAAGLLGGAIWTIARDEAVRHRCGDALAQAPWWMTLAAIALTVSFVPLSGLVFDRLTRIRDQVPLAEMTALVSASALLNLLPLKPGIASRAVYLAAMHRIPLARSVTVSLVALGISAALAVLVAAALWIAGSAGAPWWIPVGVVAVIVAMPAVPWSGNTAANHLRTPRSAALRFFCQGALCRLVEIFAAAMRSWICFQMIGTPITASTALAAGCVATIASLVPTGAGGIGVREWLVALLGPMLHAYAVDVGLAAELLGRSLDLVVTGVCGGASALWLSRRLRAVGAR